MAIAVTTPSERIRQKARGAFYTAPEITRFLAGWAIRSASDRVLEPSCGDGAFLRPLAERMANLGASDISDRLIGVEREAAEADKARSVVALAQVINTDFFDVDPSSIPPVTAVVGNPPYIRYHGFIGEDRLKGLARARIQGVELTNLASSWAHFVVHATGFLAPDGRLALVLPAELLHADYGQPVRDFLLRRFGSVVIVAFDQMIFADAQVDAVLLLASNDDRRGLRVVRLLDAQSLRTTVISASSSTGDWRPARWSGSVDSEAGAVYEETLAAGGSVALGEIAKVDIGYVSGANDFFVLTAENAEAQMLPSYALTPTVRRPRDVPGLSASRDHTLLLLDLAGKQASGDPHLLAYLARGEATGVSSRYKCRVRRPWYAVPLPRSKPDAFLPYMNHKGPRLIVNDFGGWSSNLLHGVTLTSSSPSPRALAVAMCSSLTLLSAEVEGRAYGGGVLKLETKEAERLAIPSLDLGSVIRLEKEFDRVNALWISNGCDAAAVYVDALLGLDHRALCAAYTSLRNRRLARRQAQPQPMLSGNLS